jgi:hypothetical protein
VRSLSAIACGLHHDAIPTLRGRLWRQSTIGGILNRGLHWPMRHNDEIFDGQHERLIDQATWERARDILAASPEKGFGRLPKGCGVGLPGTRSRASVESGMYLCATVVDLAAYQAALDTQGRRDLSVGEAGNVIEHDGSANFGSESIESGLDLAVAGLFVLDHGEDAILVCERLTRRVPG